VTLFHTCSGLPVTGSSRRICPRPTILLTQTELPPTATPSATPVPFPRSSSLKRSTSLPSPMSIFTRSSAELTHRVLPATAKGVTVEGSLCTFGSRAGGLISFRMAPVLASIWT
jgi:hypothetical protein